MSEYQYYEFQAVDRPLTLEEQEEVASLSSRVEPHPWRASFVYHYSGFPADEKMVLARYFDAMLYAANWGSRQLMFRFPKGLVDPGRMRPYEMETIDEPYGTVELKMMGAYRILNIYIHEPEAAGWLELEEGNLLGTLIQLRQDILDGDYRVLYLAWLKGMTLEDMGHLETEPPVPPGLGTLTPALLAFMAFVRLDADLVAVAGQASAAPRPFSETDLTQKIAQLAPERKDAFLLRLAHGEPLLSVALRRELGLSQARAQRDERPRRTVGELLSAAEAHKARRRAREEAEARARYRAELERLSTREEQAWREVHALIEEGHASAYNAALRLLVKLHDLAEMEKREEAFAERLTQIAQKYPRRRAMLGRLRKVGLLPPEG